MTEAYTPGAGDLVWTVFDPAKGREQQGRRPALVLSPRGLSASTGFVIVAPIASRVRPFPTSVVLPEGLPISGEILLNQIRSIDSLARPVKSMNAKVPSAVAEQVRAKLALLIAI